MFHAISDERVLCLEHVFRLVACFLELSITLMKFVHLLLGFDSLNVFVHNFLR